MSIQDLMQWWNLIYAIPLVTSVVWIMATVVSGTHGDGGQSHGVGHDIGHAVHGIEHAVGHVFHQAADHDAGHGDVHDLSHAGQADHANDAHGNESHDDVKTFSTTSLLFLILGIGRVPITLLIGIFLLCWGAFGLLINEFMSDGLKYPALYIWPSMGITFGVSLVITRCLAAVVGRLIPPTETFGISRLELVGSLGKTIYTTSENTGTVDIKDTYGTVHRVQAKTEPDQEAIPSGKEVMVLDFDEEDKRFIVRTSIL